MPAAVFLSIENILFIAKSMKPYHPNHGFAEQ